MKIRINLDESQPGYTLEDQSDKNVFHIFISTSQPFGAIDVLSLRTSAIERFMTIMIQLHQAYPHVQLNSIEIDGEIDLTQFDIPTLTLAFQTIAMFNPNIKVSYLSPFWSIELGHLLDRMVTEYSLDVTTAILPVESPAPAKPSRRKKKKRDEDELDSDTVQNRDIDLDDPEILRTCGANELKRSCRLKNMTEEEYLILSAQRKKLINQHSCKERRKKIRESNAELAEHYAQLHSEHQSLETAYQELQKRHHELQEKYDSLSREKIHPEVRSSDEVTRTSALGEDSFPWTDVDDSVLEGYDWARFFAAPRASSNSTQTSAHQSIADGSELKKDVQSFSISRFSK